MARVSSRIAETYLKIIMSVVGIPTNRNTSTPSNRVNTISGLRTWFEMCNFTYVPVVRNYLVITNLEKYDCVFRRKRELFPSSNAFRLSQVYDHFLS